MSDEDVVEFVLARLRPLEREFWDEYVDPYLHEDGLPVSLWGFGQICMLDAWGVPDVVGEAFDRMNFDPRWITDYQENMKAKIRRERGEH